MVERLYSVVESEDKQATYVYAQNSYYQIFERKQEQLRIVD